MPLDFNKANFIFRQINDSKLTTLKNNLFSKAIEYANIRVAWETYTLEDKSEYNTNRTAVHNSFIDKCNILSRNQAKAGEDNTWRNDLGNDRKILGDLACYFHLFIALNNR